MVRGQRYTAALRHFCPFPFAFSHSPFSFSFFTIHFSLSTFHFSPRPTRGDRGFTLLEILVALAVMSLVVVSFLRGNAMMVANAEYLRDKTLAGWVAMNRAAELRLAGQWLGENGAEGTALMADRTWRWRATGKVSPDPDMQIVTIEVRQGEGETATSLASLTMFLGQSAGMSP